MKMADSKGTGANFFLHIIPGIFKAGVPIFLCLSIGLLALYGAGNWFTDTSLVNLLRFLRYSASALVVMSLCGAGFTVWRLAAQRKQPPDSVAPPRKKRRILLVTAYLLCGFFGLVLLVLCNLIAVIAG